MARSFTSCLVFLLVATLRADLPSPRTGGVDGKPINLLVVSSRASKVNLIDPECEEQLRDAGYSLHVLSHEDMLTAEYLNQFGCVILANLPYAGEEYTVEGYKNRFVESNLALIKDYIGRGGGAVLMPAISEFGEAYGWTYDEFLKGYDARLLIQQLKDGNSRAWFRAHNPTDREITSPIATPRAVRGLKPLKTTVTVPAGASVDVSSDQ